MTPKEKADDLVSEFIFNCKHTKYVDDNGYKDSEIIRLINSKQCAVICVDEIIKHIQMPIEIPYLYSFKYWEKVKEEINKL
jgi:hypothetical protein